jgi:hypothetical protein
MTVDLKLIGARYNIITLIFFIPYVIFQPPATVVLRKVGPRVFLSAITLFWGATMIVMAPGRLPTRRDLTIDTGLRFCSHLGCPRRPPHHSRRIGGRFLPWLCISSQLLVYVAQSNSPLPSPSNSTSCRSKISTPKAKRSLLPHR